MKKKRITRRNFIGRSAGLLAAPYVITSGALGNTTTPSASNRLTVASIGVGGQGMQDTLAFCARADTQVVAVCDVDSHRREHARRRVNAEYGNEDCAVYGDFRRIIERPDIDIVCIATPDHWHIIPAIWAMRTGKDVFVEKPLTLTVDEGRAVVEAAERYGSVTQVNTWQRSIHKFQYAVELVRSGALGKVHTVKVGVPGSPAQGPQQEEPIPDGFDYDMWLGQAPWAPYNRSRCHGAFRFTFDYSGGEICDWGAHHIDIAQWGMGTDHTGPIEIEGVGEFPKEGIWNTAVHYSVICKYAEGFTMHIADNHGFFGVRFEGEDGRWIYVDRERLQANPPSLLRTALESDEMLQLWVSGDHLGNFIDAVKTRKKTVVPVETGHRSLSIAHLSNISMLLGRKLRWNPETERFVNDETANRMLSRAMRSPWHL